MLDKLLVERILTDIKSNMRALQNSTDITWKVYTSDIRAKRFVERTIHIIIEAMIDVAQHIIADEGFREPDSYRDAFLVLVENKVITPDSLQTLEHIASFRNLIVHYYERIDDEIVYGIFKKNLHDFDMFVEQIVDFLRRNA